MPGDPHLHIRNDRTLEALRKILEQARIARLHLAEITGEEITSRDIKEL